MARTPLYGLKTPTPIGDRFMRSNSGCVYSVSHLNDFACEPHKQFRPNGERIPSVDPCIMHFGTTYNRAFNEENEKKVLGSGNIVPASDILLKRRLALSATLTSLDSKRTSMLSNNNSTCSGYGSGCANGNLRLAHRSETTRRLNLTSQEVFDPVVLNCHKTEKDSRGGFHYTPPTLDQNRDDIRLCNCDGKARSDELGRYFDGVHPRDVVAMTSLGYKNATRSSSASAYRYSQLLNDTRMDLHRSDTTGHTCDIIKNTTNEGKKGFNNNSIGCSSNINNNVNAINSYKLPGTFKRRSDSAYIRGSTVYDSGYKFLYQPDFKSMLPCNEHSTNEYLAIRGPAKHICTGGPAINSTKELSRVQSQRNECTVNKETCIREAYNNIYRTTTNTTYNPKNSEIKIDMTSFSNRNQPSYSKHLNVSDMHWTRVIKGTETYKTY